MPEPNLPGAERDVLASLHRLGKATAREIREALHSYRPMAHGSVVTLLKRLEAKGLVTRKKSPVGKAFVFEAARKTQPAFRRLVKDLLHRVFHGDGVALVASLFETKPPTPEEAQKLRQMLDDLREQQTPGGKRT